MPGMAAELVLSAAVLAAYLAVHTAQARITRLSRKFNGDKQA